MARARNIKPGFFTNDNIVELPFEVRLLFIGLWTIADKKGRLCDRPKKIKMEIFPADDVDCDKAISMLAAHGFLRRYEVSGNRYIQIINWNKHQNPHIKEADSSIPEEEPEISVQAQEIQERAGLIPDSLNLIPDSPISDYLIPDSLIPEETTMSGNPDDGKQKLMEILEYLNRKTGKGFRPVDSNLKLIRARLREGITESELMAIVDRKCAEWIGTKWELYLRPSTLFGAENCNQYVGELTKPSEAEESDRKLREWLGEDGAIEGEVM